MSFKFNLMLIIEERCPSSALKEVKAFPDKVVRNTQTLYSIPLTRKVKDSKCALATPRLVNAPNFIKLDVKEGLVIIMPIDTTELGTYTFQIEQLAAAPARLTAMQVTVYEHTTSRLT